MSNRWLERDGNPIVSHGLVKTRYGFIACTVLTRPVVINSGSFVVRRFLIRRGRGSLCPNAEAQTGIMYSDCVEEVVSRRGNRHLVGALPQESREEKAIVYKERVL